MKKIKLLAWVTVLGLWAGQAQSYNVWLGTHKWEGAAADNLDQWDMAIDKIDGINYVLLDARPDRPAGEGANTSDWNTMIAPIDQSIPGMAEIARSQYAPAHSRTLAERMENEFATVENRGAEIDIIMLYDEEKNGTVWKFYLQDVQDVRAWLDSNGHSDVSIVFRLTNNDQERLGLAQQSVVDGVLIEASATRWVEDRFNVHTLLQDLWTDPSTSYKNIYFQIPRHESPVAADRNGIPTSPINQYIETRRALWVIKDLMGTAFMQSEQANFIICSYGDTFPTYPETENDDTLYVNSKSGVALSLIEQRDVFEGRVGVVNEALCVSYDRYEVTPGPTSGLVAHWPLDEGSGTNAADIAGYGFDGQLINGATWGIDAERGTYAVFDGTNDHITTTFTYALADTNDFTWAWWAKSALASTDPTQKGSIMVGSRYGNTGSETFEFIKFTPQGAQFADTDNSGTIEKYAYVDIPQNEWHHYAMVKSGTSYQWYIDGVAQGSSSNFVYSETSPIPFLIGGDDNGTAKPNEHFEGCIDDVLLYREALTSTEVLDVKNGDYPYAPPVYELIVGWDTWSSATAPAASVLGSNVTASAATTVEQQSWNVIDERGASNDGDWGTFMSVPSASAVTNADNENLTLINADTGGTITFAVTNNGTDNIDLGSVHFDAYAFRSKAPRTFELSVLAGSDISDGVVFTSAANAISEVNGANDNGAHDDIDISLTGLADHTLEPGESVRILLAFSGGAGDEAGGHHLFVDNLGLSGAYSEYMAPPVIALIAGWDTWVDAGGDVYNATVLNGAAGMAVGTADTSGGHPGWGNWGGATAHNSGASVDGSWGTVVTNPPSTGTNATDAVGLMNNTPSGEMTFTITNTSGGRWELAGFHFDGVRVRTSAADNWAVRILAGSAVTEGTVSSGTILSDASSPFLDRENVDVDLTGLSDRTVEPGESIILELAWTGGTGAAAGGNSTMMDNVALTGSISLSTEPPVLEYSMSGGDLVFNWAGNGFKVQSRTNLLEGIWSDMSGGDTPPVTNSTTDPQAFFRLIQQ